MSLQDTINVLKQEQRTVQKRLTELEKKEAEDVSILNKLLDSLEIIKKVQSKKGFPDSYKTLTTKKELANFYSKMFGRNNVMEHNILMGAYPPNNFKEFMKNVMYTGMSVESRANDIKNRIGSYSEELDFLRHHDQELDRFFKMVKKSPYHFEGENGWYNLMVEFPTIETGVEYDWFDLSEDKHIS